MRDFILSAFADEADKNFDVQLQTLRALNIPLLELRGVDGVNVADLTDQQLAEVKDKLQNAGVKLSAIGSPIGKINIEDPMEPELRRLERVLHIAKTLQAPAIRMFSFYIPTEDPLEKWRDEVLRRMQAMAKTARGSGVRLLLENEKGLYGASIAGCQDILETLGDDYGLVFDPANFVQTGEDTLRAFQILGNYVVYMHIKDAKDGKMVPAGEGNGNISQLLAKKMALSGPCILTLEPHLSHFSGLDSQHRPGTAVENMLNTARFESAQAAFAYATKALRTIIAELPRRAT